MPSKFQPGDEVTVFVTIGGGYHINANMKAYGIYSGMNEKNDYPYFHEIDWVIEPTGGTLFPSYRESEVILIWGADWEELIAHKETINA